MIPASGIAVGTDETVAIASESVSGRNPVKVLELNADLIVAPRYWHVDSSCGPG